MCPCVTLMSFWRWRQQVIKLNFYCNFLNFEVPHIFNFQRSISLPFCSSLPPPFKKHAKFKVLKTNFFFCPIWKKFWKVIKIHLPCSQLKKRGNQILVPPLSPTHKLKIFKSLFFLLFFFKQLYFNNRS